MGVDLSGQKLRQARTRGLPVAQSDLVALPFPDGWFDVVCCFKVLPHVERVREALAELGRVVRPGGLLVAEFYNPRSIRGLLWRVKTPGHVGHGINEREVYVRFDTPAQARAHLPGGFRVVAARGARVVTVLPQAHRVPVVGPALALVERLLADPLAAWGSFYNVVARKE
jgi:SAM-dependent methyltransferase